MVDPAPSLDEDRAAADPFAQFATWFAEAAALTRAPEALALATADRSGRPSARMVLLKSWDRDGFVFYTNFGSRKGEELDANPRAAMLFYWEPLGRQVRIEGPVSRVPSDVADRYFATRPLGAQLGAVASHQSRPLESRRALTDRVAEVRSHVADSPLVRPPWWGGYRLAPESFEFWQNRAERLHDRLRYRPEGASWSIERLAP